MGHGNLGIGSGLRRFRLRSWKEDVAPGACSGDAFSPPRAALPGTTWAHAGGCGHPHNQGPSAEGLGTELHPRPSLALLPAWHNQ